MGKFKKAMKAIGKGAVAVGEAIATSLDPQHWYDQAADSMRRGRIEEAQSRLATGLDLERRYGRRRV